MPSLTRTIDRSRDALQRPTGYELKTDNLTLESSVGYGYDVSGRLASISASGLPNLPGKSHAFEYGYLANSSLIDKVTGPVHKVDNDYEANRNVLLQKKNTRTVGTAGELSVIGYGVNDIGQRVLRNLSGEIRAEFYGGQSTDLYVTNWGYDALGQVIGEDKPSTEFDRGYSYDQIGNRLASTADAATTSYASNQLNQYSLISRPSPASLVNPAFDDDGNMTTGQLNGSTSGQFEYDAANQLIRTQSTTTSDPTRYAYDAFGRRVAKITYPNGGVAATAATVFIYDGWNLIAEYFLQNSSFILHASFTWGLDLSGSIQGAGGVGGLLAVAKHQEPGTTNQYYPIYDGNGNIEAYLDSNGVPSAIYQYDAFGNVLTGGGKGAAIEQAKFSHRFSTKCQDGETGLLYYGYRYCQTAIGRWVNRDPIEEAGGINLYTAVSNAPLSFVDVLGFAPASWEDVMGSSQKSSNVNWPNPLDYSPDNFSQFSKDTLNVAKDDGIMALDDSMRAPTPRRNRSDRPLPRPKLPNANRGAADVGDMAGPSSNFPTAAMGAISEAAMWNELLRRSREGKAAGQAMADVHFLCNKAWENLTRNHPRYFKEGCPACCLYSYQISKSKPVALNDGRTYYVEQKRGYRFLGFEPGACADVLEKRPAGWVFGVEEGWVQREDGHQYGKN